jgi:hypothetical protein
VAQAIVRLEMQIASTPRNRQDAVPVAENFSMEALLPRLLEAVESTCSPAK